MVIWLILLLGITFPVAADLNTPLFQNKFFSLSTDNQLLCRDNHTGFLSVQQLLETIHFYEQHNPIELRFHAVKVLTDHHNQKHIDDLANHQIYCKTAPSIDLCLLEAYWDNEPEAALRALALFYDTKTIIKQGENYQARRFNKDHLRIFEKAIRKIPPFMRHTISRAKPLQLDKEIATMDASLQQRIQDAYPQDFSTSIWSDETHPLTFVTGIGFQSQVVAQVYNGQNLIIFTVKAFDKGKANKLYRDINLKYLVDFRIPIIVHEIAHTIDNFHFWKGDKELYFFYRHRKMSNDNDTVKLINQAKLALWPSKWFEAFEYLWEVNQGRYNGFLQEKLAELVAQYILIPERLQQSSPESYAWLRDKVFKQVEYQGYDRCRKPIVRPLTLWEHAIAKALGE